MFSRRTVLPLHQPVLVKTRKLLSVQSHRICCRQLSLTGRLLVLDGLLQKRFDTLINSTIIFTASRRQFSLDNFLSTFYTHNYFFSSSDTDRQGLRRFVHSRRRPVAFLYSFYVFLNFILISCFFILTSKNFLSPTLYVIPPIVEYGINRRLNLPGNEVIKHIYCMDYDLIYWNTPELIFLSRGK